MQDAGSMLGSAGVIVVGLVALARVMGDGMGLSEGGAGRGRLPP